MSEPLWLHEILAENRAKVASWPAWKRVRHCQDEVAMNDDEPMETLAEALNKQYAESDLGKALAENQTLRDERDRLRANLVNCVARLEAYYGEDYPAVRDAKAAMTPAEGGQE